MTSSSVFKSALAFVVLVACLGLMGDAEADDLVPLWSDQPSSSQNPTSVAMSDDGSVIAMTSGNEKLYVYTRNSSTPEWYYDANKDILSSAVSGNGKYLVIGLGWNDDSDFGKIILFDTSSNTPLWSHTTIGHIYKVDTMLFLFFPQFRI